MMPESSERERPGLRGAAPSPRAAMRKVLEQALDEPPESRGSLPVIPDHELLQRIGMGAYGDVWMARNALGSLRAVKVVYRDRFEEERPFQREFQGIVRYEPVSRTHEGLVAILHVGRNDSAGYFYYVMELADNWAQKESPVAGQPAGERHPDPADHGPPLVTHGYTPRTLRCGLGGQRRLATVEAARLVLQLANALEHLHSRGLVHRDIKPSNIIFVGGRPKLADIGLVAAAGDSRSFVGTEGFVPPEGPGTVEADIYSLGKVLYELSTGLDRLDFPRLPTGLPDEADGEALLDLNEVITRACDTDPRKRYARATDFAADVQMFLVGRSLRSARKAEAHLVWLRRFAILGGLVILLAGLAVLVARRSEKKAQAREQESRKRAETEAALRERAERAERQARTQLYTALVDQARALVGSKELGQRVQALEALHSAAMITNGIELRREALRALSVPDLRFDRQLDGPVDATLLQVDPRFERLALCRGAGPVEIRSVADNRLLKSLPASSQLDAYVGQWSADGRFLAIKRDRTDVQGRADIEVWRISDGRLMLLITNTPNGAFAFHPHHPWLTVGLSDGLLQTRDVESRSVVSEYRLKFEATSLALAPEGDRFAAVYDQDGGATVSIRWLTNGQPVASHHFEHDVECLDWHPNGHQLAVPEMSGVVHLMDPVTGQVQTLGRHKAQAVFAAFSPDGNYLFTGGWERELVCWDLRTHERVLTISRNGFVAQFSNYDRRCAILDRGTIQLFTFEEPSCVGEFQEDLGGLLLRAALSPDGRWLAATGVERLGVWDLAIPGPARRLSEGADARVYFSGQSDSLYASGAQRPLGWQLKPAPESGMPPELQPLVLPEIKEFTGLSARSNYLVLTGRAGSAVLAAEQPSGAAAFLQPTTEGVSGISGNGRWLGIYRPYTSDLHIYGLPDLKPIAVLENQVGFVQFEFSPSGDEIGIASPERIDFWSTHTWQRTRRVANFRGLMYCPDGATLWLTQDFRTGGLYAARDLKLLLPLPHGVLPLALSENGQLVVVSVDATRLQVWDLERVHQEFSKLGIDWVSPGAAN